jgi:spore germination protein KC
MILILIILTIFISKEIRITTIDDLAYVVAIGLDCSDDNALKVSFQIASTSENSSDSGGTDNATTSKVTTVEASSIDNAINLVNTYTSKELSLAHCKVIVLSEKLAAGGISNYLYTLINKMEISPKCNIIISRVDSEYFLEEASSTLEKNSTRYYEIIPTTFKYTGYTDTITLRDFFSRMGDTFAQPYAILGSVNIGNANSSSASSNSETEKNVKAGEISITSDNKIEITGLAVFNADTLVGELNAMETICHLMLINKLENCTISIPSPFNNVESIDLYLSLKKNTKFNVKLVNGSPFITTNVYVDARILTMTKDSDYLDSENLNDIETYANSYLKYHITNYLYKTSKEFKSDIIGLGKYVVGNFSTWDDWVQYDWLNKYEASFFDVNVETDVKSGYLLLET